MYLTLCLTLVFLSGFTGLVYQVTWQRYLAYHLGSNALASTLILAVFFLFLSIGYFVIGRSSHRLLHNKLVLYGILEGLIGAYCVVSPEFFQFLANGFSFHVESESLELVLDLVFTSLFIGFPTFLMGGTIPVLTDALTVEYEDGHRTHALIYGTNTAGAFLGALAAGFVMIERLGLPGTIVTASGINLALFFATFAIAKFSSRSAAIVEPARAGGERLDRSVQFALWGQAFLSGFYVFSLENLLIRMAGISLGSSTYTYTIIVASFVLAIALGSLSVSVFRRIVGFRFFLAVQTLLLATVVALYFVIPHWPAIFLRTRFAFYLGEFNHGIFWAAVLLVFLALLLIPVGLMGMNLPLLFNYLRSRRQYLSEVVGQIYAVNSVGSALGAVIGGYWLFHFMESDAVFRFSLVMVVLTLPLLFWLYAGESRSRRRAAALPLLLVPVVALLPDWEEKSFAPGYFVYSQPPTDTVDFGAYYAKAREDVESRFTIVSTRHDPGAIVHVVDDSRGRALYVNGKPDSHTDADRLPRTLTALTPISIAKNVERIFIIGLGAGLSTSVAAQFDEVKSIEVAEISQGVIDSLPEFAAENQGLEENREKVTIVRGDARQVLLREDRRFDLILCEPSSTWVAGVEKLFTLDFYQQAIDKLEPDGLYAQWLTVGNLDPDTFVTILATFARVFPWTTAFSAGGGTITLIGSREAPEVDFDRMAARYAENPQIYAGVYLAHPLAILGNQLFAPATVAALVAGREDFQSLEHPILAYRSGRALFVGRHVDLDQVVTEGMADALEPDDAASRFLLDSYPEALPPEYFRARQAFEAGAHLNWNLARSRTRWLQALAGIPDRSRAFSPAMLRQGVYLLSGSDGPPPADAARMIETYWTLKFSQFPVRTETLVEMVDASCARGNCTALQFRLLQTHLSGDALVARGIDLPTQRAPIPMHAAAEIRAAYEEVFHGKGGPPGTL